MVIDAIVRQRPGVLERRESAEQESFAAGLLDCPHYNATRGARRPARPDVLLSGHHEAIRAWRLQQSLGRTWERRPDLLRERALSSEKIICSRLIRRERDEKEGTQLATTTGEGTRARVQRSLAPQSLGRTTTTACIRGALRCTLRSTTGKQP
jgi:hypothetical protein